MKKLIVMVALILVTAAIVIAGSNEAYGSGRNEAYGSLQIAYNNFTDATAPAQLGATGQRKYRSVPWTEVELFDDITEWASNVNTTDATNTTEVVTSVNTVLSSIKLTMSGSGEEGNASKSGVGWGDVRNSHLFVRFYVHDGTGTANPDRIDNIQIRLADGVSPTNWILRSLFTWNNMTDYTGWHEQTLSLDLVTVGGGADRAALLNGGIDHLRIIIKTTGDADSTVAVTFDLIAVIPALPQPKYMFTFDDGLATDVKFASYLHAKGLRGTFFIQGSKVGTTSYMTLDQIHLLQNMGHLIANHGWTNFDVQADGTTDEQLRRELTRTTEFLCANGFSAGSRLFALPNGSGSRTEALWNKHYKYWDGLRVTATVSVLTPGVWSTGVISTDSFDSTTDAATALTNAIAGNTLVVTGWHTSSGSFTYTNWKTHVDAVLVQVQAGAIDVITMDEWVYQAGRSGIHNIMYVGSGTPSIKVKKLTGTSPAVGASNTIAHGLDKNKIIGAQALICNDSDNPIPPNFTSVANHEFDFFIDTSDIHIYCISANSSSINGNTVIVLITYEE